MKRLSTDDFLILGMALTADKTAMEQRVRGVFARKNSAKPTKALTILLCVILGVGCFTTACQPAEEVPENAERDFKAISSDLPAQTHVPDPEYFFDNSINENLDDTNAFLSTCVEEPFTPLQVPTAFSESETEIANNVFMTIEANVTVPETDGYSVTRFRSKQFTIEEYRSMISYFLPDAAWQSNMTTICLPDGGEFDLNEIGVSDGFRFSVIRGERKMDVAGWQNGSGFFFGPGDDVVYREGYLVNDEEMETEFGEEIRMPISLTREDAQALSDKTISDMGITGVVLDSAQRACLFAEGDADGYMPVLTRGWAFIYTQDNNGLRAFEYHGSGGGPRDPLKYVASESTEIQVYVDNDGVTMFWCNKFYSVDEVVFDNVAILSAEDALQLFKDRLAHVMSYDAERRTSAEYIDVLSVTLASMAIADASGEHTAGYQGDGVETFLMVPIWSVRFRITHDGGPDEYCTYPFSATDGGALTRMDG